MEGRANLRLVFLSLRLGDSRGVCGGRLSSKGRRFCTLQSHNYIALGKSDPPPRCREGLSSSHSVSQSPHPSIHYSLCGGSNSQSRVLCLHCRCLRDRLNDLPSNNSLKGASSARKMMAWQLQGKQLKAGSHRFHQLPLIYRTGVTSICHFGGR